MRPRATGRRRGRRARPGPRPCPPAKRLSSRAPASRPSNAAWFGRRARARRTALVVTTVGSRLLGSCHGEGTPPKLRRWARRCLPGVPWPREGAARSSSSRGERAPQGPVARVGERLGGVTGPLELAWKTGRFRQGMPMSTWWARCQPCCTARATPGRGATDARCAWSRVGPCSPRDHRARRWPAAG